MKKENIEFIDGIDSILHKKTNKIFWIIPSILGLLILSIVIWLSVSEIDVIAPSNGKIVTNSKIIPIQSNEISTIEKIYVKNGQRVKKGEILVSFKKDVEEYEYKKIKVELENLKEQKNFTQEYEKYLSKNLALDANLSYEDSNMSLILQSYIFSFQKDVLTYRAKLTKLQHEIDTARLEIEKLSKLIPYTKEKIDKLTPLVNKKLESQNTLQEYEIEYITQNEDRKIKTLVKDKLISKYNIIARELEQYVHNMLKENRKILKTLNDDINKLEPEVQKMKYLLHMKSLYANTDGIIYNLSNNVEGKVIQSGDIIMEVIPFGTTLEVEAKVLNRDIGFVQMGQTVKVKLDSFKFTKYGYIEGKITNIEQASIKDEQLGEVYLINVALKDKSIKVENKNIELIPGMTCTVDIKTSKRKLIEYIISPMIRYQDEALRER